MANPPLKEDLNIELPLRNSLYIPDSVPLLEEGTAYQPSNHSDPSSPPSNALDTMISKIGFGKFHQQMLVLCGLGWLADNMWLQAIAIILPRVKRHFDVSTGLIGLLSSSIFFGMMLGSLFWGLFSDSNGRKIAFNYTLAVSSFFGILSSFAPSFWSLCLCLLCLGFGVGGNMPVDGALFLEFIPKESHYLLTFLSVFFSFGAVLSSFLAWLIIPNQSCQDINKLCDVSHENNGWRYLLFSLGLINLMMVLGRVVWFSLPESPKFLMSQNRPNDVIDVLKHIIHINGTDMDIELEDIQTNTRNSISLNDYNSFSPESFQPLTDLPEPEHMELNSNRLDWSKFYSLFNKEYYLTTILIWLIWSLTSLAYTMFNVFLPVYLELKGGNDKSNENSTLSQIYLGFLLYSLSGIPGSILGSYLVETPLGRLGTMYTSSFLTSISLVLFVYATTTTTMVSASGLVSFLVTIMYAVIYAYTPEVFDPKVRGTACGIASALSRIAGIIAPLLTGYLLNLDLSLPIYLSSILFMIISIAMYFLPVETKGRAN